MATTTNIFNSPYVASEVVSTNGAVITWSIGSVDTTGRYSETKGGAETMPLLVNQLAINATRQVQSYYPLNQTTKLDILGAMQGVLTIQGLLTSAAANLEEFLAVLSNPCGRVVQITVHTAARNNCDTDSQKDTTNSTYRMTGCILNTFGVAIQGGEVATINMPLQIIFSKLDVGIAAKEEAGGIVDIPALLS
mgnify:CR=1 FL=1|jgi:hypothetical protein